MPPKGKLTSGQVAGYLWLALLVVALLVSVSNAYRQALKVEEYPYACDSFGYLQMAKDIRQTRRGLDVPLFELESRQSQLLIDLMRSRGLPLSEWNNLVAPHAYHFLPVSERVGVQYPPGTALTLALYREGHAVYSLNRTVVYIFLATGLGALALAFARRAWASAGLVVLALHLGLEILVRIGAVSFSINAALVPILMACVLSMVALRLRSRGGRGMLARVAAFAAGLCLGYATFIRLPAILLAPGLLLLLLDRPRDWRKSWRELPAAFALALALSGVVPILVYQHFAAGAWYISTYTSIDAALPAFDRIKHNLSYYFGEGYATEDNWVFIYLLAGFVGFVLSMRSRSGGGDEASDGAGSGLTWRRLAASAVVLWGLPTVFFLTHQVTGLHYAMVQTFGVAALLGFGALTIESARRPGGRSRVGSGAGFDERGAGRRTLAALLGVVLALAPGLVTLWRGVKTRETTTPAPTQPLYHKPVILPPELLDERAWIYADLLTGTIWYYNNKPAFRAHFGTPRARAVAYRFIHERGEPQYLIRDNDGLQPLMDEITRLGGTLERRGQVEGQDYFLIRWPESGPKS